MIQADWNPDDEKLRDFGLIGALFVAGLAVWVAATSETDPSTAVTYLGCFSAALMLGAFYATPVIRPLYIALTAITIPIGWVISHTVLAVLFYGILTPIGLALRILRADPLCRAYDPTLKTYWVRRPPPAPASRYFRQY